MHLKIQTGHCGLGQHWKRKSLHHLNGGGGWGQVGRLDASSHGHSTCDLSADERESSEPPARVCRASPVLHLHRQTGKSRPCKYDPRPTCCRAPASEMSVFNSLVRLPISQILCVKIDKNIKKKKRRRRSWSIKVPHISCNIFWLFISCVYECLPAHMYVHVY